MSIEEEIRKPQTEALQISDIRRENAPSGSEITASQKCSITLYQTDLDILDEIREYLRQKGFAISPIRRRLRLLAGRCPSMTAL